MIEFSNPIGGKIVGSFAPASHVVLDKIKEVSPLNPLISTALLFPEVNTRYVHPKEETHRIVYVDRTTGEGVTTEDLSSSTSSIVDSEQDSVIYRIPSNSVYRIWEYVGDLVTGIATDRKVKELGINPAASISLHSLINSNAFLNLVAQDLGAVGYRLSGGSLYIPDNHYTKPADFLETELGTIRDFYNPRSELHQLILRARLVLDPVFKQLTKDHELNVIQALGSYFSNFRDGRISIVEVNHIHRRKSDRFKISISISFGRKTENQFSGEGKTRVQAFANAIVNANEHFLVFRPESSFDFSASYKKSPFLLSNTKLLGIRFGNENRQVAISNFNQSGYKNIYFDLGQKILKSYFFDMIAKEMHTDGTKLDIRTIDDIVSNMIASRPKDGYPHISRFLAHSDILANENLEKFFRIQYGLKASAFHKFDWAGLVSTLVAIHYIQNREDIRTTFEYLDKLFSKEGCDLETSNMGAVRRRKDRFHRPHLANKDSRR